MTVKTQHILITRPDGTVAVMQFILEQPRRGDDPGWKRDATTENVEAEILKSQIPCKKWRLISSDELPTNREFRNAWVDTGKSVTPDMERCRHIHRQRLRHAREPELVRLDVEHIRTVEEQETWTQSTRNLDTIRKCKQALRDITVDPRIDQSKTPEELSKVTVEEVVRAYSILQVRR